MNAVDLLIPIHGEAPYLEATLNSLVAANLAEVKIIMILDRAADQTISRVKDFSERIELSEVLFSDTPGIVSALNLGISKTEGKFVARLDSDDLVSPRRFETQFNFLQSNPEVVLLGSQMTFINDAGKGFGRTNYPNNHEQIVRLLKFQNCIGHPSVMLRRDALVSVNGYRNSYTGAEDLDLWLRLAKIGSLHNLEEALTSYRISPNQFSRHVLSNQGVVETSVKLADLGLEVRTNGTEHWPSARELQESNSLNVQLLRNSNFKNYREFKCREVISTGYFTARSNTQIFVRILRLVKIILKASIVSPCTTWSFLTLKLRYVNRGR
jgi:glycosyltransferase involved in cell wall biosynthesis